MHALLPSIFAEAAGANPPATMDTQTVLAVVGVVVTSIITAFLGHKKGAADAAAKAREVTLTNLPQPLEVRWQAEFVTRREFERYQNEMGAGITKIEGIVTAMSVKVESTFERLAEKVEDVARTAHEETEKVASVAYNGRQKIWEELNPVRERVARVEERNHVQVQMAEAIASAVRKETGKGGTTKP